MSLPPRRTAASVNPEPAVAVSFQDLLNSLGSEASRAGYEKDWVAFREWLVASGLDVLQAKPVDVKRYVSTLLQAKKAKATRGRALSVIRATYRAFVEDGLLAVNPAREIKNPPYGGATRTPWLREPEIQRLLAWRGDESWRDRRDRACVQLLAGLGRRREEIARVAVEDFRGNELRSVIKGGKEKWMRIPAWVVTEVTAWITYAKIDSGAVLPRSRTSRKAISGDIVYKIVRRVGAATGLPPETSTPHALRRSLATLAREKGASLADIQETLGHASLVTTERYLKGSRQVEHAPGEWMGELVRK